MVAKNTSLTYDSGMNEEINEAIFDRIIEHVSVSELAGTFSISNPAVFQWRINGIPSNRAAIIEKMTNGEVRRHEMCPNFPWDA